MTEKTRLERAARKAEKDAAWEKKRRQFWMTIDQMREDVAARATHPLADARRERRARAADRRAASTAPLSARELEQLRAAWEQAETRRVRREQRRATGGPLALAARIFELGCFDGRRKEIERLSSSTIRVAEQTAHIPIGSSRADYEWWEREVPPPPAPTDETEAMLKRLKVMCIKDDVRFEDLAAACACTPRRLATIIRTPAPAPMHLGLRLLESFGVDGLQFILGQTNEYDDGWASSPTEMARRKFEAAVRDGIIVVAPPATQTISPQQRHVNDQLGLTDEAFLKYNPDYGWGA